MKGKRPIKILLIRNAYFYDFGGGERFPVELAVELKNRGFFPIVVSKSEKLLSFAATRSVSHVKGWWWARQDWSGINVFLFPVYFFWQLILTLWYIQLILKTQADILHPQSKDDFIAATIAGRLLRKRVVWTDHADLKYVLQNYKVWYKNPIGKIIFQLSKLANTVTLVSESEKKLIEACLKNKVPNNYQVIYNGVTSAPVVMHPKQNVDKDTVIFAATSRLVTAKGIGELIDAFSTLSVEQKNIRLWLFGEGPEEARFREMAKDNERIVFWGFPDDTLSRVASADIFVHPSYHEGFSISLVEATKLGLPIIACNVGGNPEIIKSDENGILVPERDANSLMYAMEKLAGSAVLRKKYGEKSREIYEKNFVFEKLVENRFIPLYE